MRGRKGLRDRWLTEVLRTDALNNGAKLVLIALSRHMDEHGRVRYPREKLAVDVGLKSLQRVTDRIKEAKDAGFLIADGGGINGTVAQYYAQLPGTPLRGTSSAGPGNGSRGTRNGVPEPAAAEPPGTPPRGAIRAPARARATSETRSPAPAPADSRGPRPHRSANSSSNGKRARRLSLVAACPSAPTTRTGDNPACA